MKKLFIAAAGTFGLVPGIIVLRRGIWTPPGYGQIFGGIIVAFGALAILLLVFNRKSLKCLPPRKATSISVALAALSLCFLLGYSLMFKFCVVSHPIHGTVYYPLWNSGHALEIVDFAGGRYAAVDHYGSYPVMKAIQQAPNYPFSLVITTILLLLTYQGIFTSLAVAFGIIGARDDVGLKKTLGVGKGKLEKYAHERKKVKSAVSDS